jgi:phosphate transport system ATP-binding protein
MMTTDMFATNAAMRIHKMSVYYGHTRAVKDVTMVIKRNKITSLIGPSGCGKSTVLRTLNRMNDLVDGARIEGEVFYGEKNIYEPNVDPIEVRRRVGMVFQKPNPFPKSIYDNIAYGPRILGIRNKQTLDDIVEHSLCSAALWDEVKSELKKSGTALSGGQQQRLCIARAIAVEPEIILMDEPCSSLDPISTQRIEELMQNLVKDYTIVIVTHNMQQATRVSDYTAFFNIRKANIDGHETRWGELVEFGDTAQVFNSPEAEETADYISGRFG